MFCSMEMAVPYKNRFSLAASRQLKEKTVPKERRRPLSPNKRDGADVGCDRGLGKGPYGPSIQYIFGAVKKPSVE